MPRRYRKRWNKKRRFTRKKRKGLPKGRRKLKAFCKFNMLAPQQTIAFNSGRVSNTSYNTYQTMAFDNCPTVGSPYWHVIDMVTEHYATQAALEKRKFVSLKEQQLYEYTNNSAHEVIFDMYKLTPNVKFTKSLFTNYSIGQGELGGLVDALAAADLIDFSDKPYINIMSSRLVRKYFKSLKHVQLCLEPGKSFKIVLNGLRYRFIDGDKLFDDDLQEWNPKACKFWYIRFRGGTVHDTMNNALVGTGQAFIDYIHTRKFVFYTMPDQTPKIELAYLTDTITQGEAMHDQDNDMKDDDEV